jgi:hypothetical protein
MNRRWHVPPGASRLPCQVVYSFALSVSLWELSCHARHQARTLWFVINGCRTAIKSRDDRFSSKKQNRLKRYCDPEQIL